MVDCSAPWQGSDTASRAAVTSVPLDDFLVVGSSASRPRVAICVVIFVSVGGLVIGLI